MKPKLIIFTDLDGTLLDSRYSFEKAKPALILIKKKKIPLILCSSKTKTEIEYYRRKLKNKHPFISENGGGIFIPKGYFRFQVSGIRGQVKGNEKYHIIKLGASYSELRKALEELRSKGFDVKGFGDMSIKEICSLTGLRPSEARLAKQRDFDEPFVFIKGNKTSLKNLKQFIKSKGLTYTQGEFFHLTSNSDKGKAVKVLKKLYIKQKGKITTVALGDNPNDIEMLKNVDYPVIVKNKTGKYNTRVKLKNLIKAEGIGPEGWNTAVLRLLDITD